ncbi:dihydrolipoamide dehydrogenase [Legionella sp. km535]|uniref:dihydrolipoyl dehydrogenase family protein n=1 Tax=Legionella sp. km535 TaxID=2498107 RepID=UPI000F8DC207|nr:FAD-dependent oxidoreductase [Legionella sp. km535]RUR20017.1 dihydrolipoamide dehydrogenase [Legionella sp. km535]
MNKEISCDIAIIGAGAGGLSLAAGAAQLGLKVVLIEQGLMGGDCLNYGCVPSKALLAAAAAHWHTGHNEVLGMTIPQEPVDFTRIMQHVREVIDTIAVHDSVERFEGLGVQVIQAKGTFINDRTLKAGSAEIKAKRYVIATGSSAAIPPIPGLNSTHFYTNETIFKLIQLPPELLIIGGGPIGCELAQAFAMLGSKVTLLEHFGILNHDDPEAVEQVRQSLIGYGITLYEQIDIVRIETNEAKQTLIQCKQNNDEILVTGTHLLVATGRKPNIDQLNCGQAGIQFSPKGILVDKRLRTSNKKIYAIGDVTGIMLFTHIANYHAGIVLQNIAFKLPVKMHDNAIPWVTYTTPELAHVGKSESMCASMGIKYELLKADYSSNDRAQTCKKTNGFIKVIINPKGGILGVTIVGDQAGELLLPWVMAIREGKTLRAFTDTIVAYPTLSELSKRVASQFYTPKLFSKKVKKLVKFLSYF